MRVNVARDYKTGPPEKKVHEFLPLTFDVEQFKRTFGKLDKYKTMMDEIDHTIEMLRKDSAGSTAIATTWFQRFSAWLQPVFGCLPYAAANDAVGHPWAEGAECYGSSHSNLTGGEASYQKVTARAMMVST